MEFIGRGARIRTGDLLRPRLDQHDYLVHLAAHLATFKKQKSTGKTLKWH